MHQQYESFVQLLLAIKSNESIIQQQTAFLIVICFFSFSFALIAILLNSLMICVYVAVRKSLIQQHHQTSMAIYHIILGLANIVALSVNYGSSIMIVVVVVFIQTNHKEFLNNNSHLIFCRLIPYAACVVSQFVSWIQALLTYDRYFNKAHFNRPITLFIQKRNNIIKMAGVLLATIMVANLAGGHFHWWQSTADANANKRQQQQQQQQHYSSELINVAYLNSSLSSNQSDDSTVATMTAARIFCVGKSSISKHYNALLILLPFILILTGNCLLFRALIINNNNNHNNHNNSSSLSTASTAASWSNKETKHFAITVIVTNAIHLLFILPSIIIFLIINNDHNHDDENHADSLMAMIMINYFAVGLVYLVPFCVNLKFNKLFRSEFLTLIRSISDFLPPLYQQRQQH